MSGQHPDPYEPEPRLVADLRKNSNEIARIQLRVFKATKLIDIRSHALQKDGVPRPTPKGISLNIAVLPELIDALIQAQKIAREVGWLSDTAKAA